MSKKWSRKKMNDEAHQARRIIQGKLNEISLQYGFESIELGGVTFSEAGNIRFQLDVTLAGGLTHSEDRYAHWETVLDLPPLGSKLQLKPGGAVCEICGINTTGTNVFVMLGDREYPVPIATAKALVQIFEGGKE